MVTCYRHPDRPTGLACSRCGRPACPECLRPASVGQHCLECLRSDGAAQPRQVRRGFTGSTGQAVAAPRTTRYPYVTYGLIAFNVLVFVICVGQAGGTDMLNSSLFTDWALFKPFVHDGEYWRLLTAGFLHFSLTHIAANMLSLFLLGRDLELAIGYPRYAGVYLASLVGGSAAVMLFAGDLTINAGASGAIYGLMGAMLVIVLRMRASPVPVLSIIGLNIVLSITVPGISLAAHLGGLLFGALATAGLIYLPQVAGDRGRTPAGASLLGWAVIATLVIVGMGIAVGAALAYEPTSAIIR
ncbi:membrane associated rhomboid family serine protease [Gordonia amarae]|uniref:Rhomboid family protein n=1 Tax=Gordonia amarae NBRC 15530 TaxID=1075090 RepID=G7GQ63_9ACTN|nr:rhomboid family intramembrane serine protease [Gordonia amarae]MCS3876759.1 membrane associated rhomboid family serine protease [Gordonia amarae]GAB05738.1 rhomboid family protein [Gordonia amarae NBRC 15530]